MLQNFLIERRTINCRGKLLDLSEPLVMGILNVTPDSFYDGAKYINEQQIETHVQKMLDEGASIIDIGGYSSRPGAEHISEEEEIYRLIPVVQFVHKHFPGAIISVDTFRAGIAEKAIESGASIINDISGGAIDDKMFDVIARNHVPYILMHMKGNPQNMQFETNYENLMEEILFYFATRVNRLREKGVKDIIIDPGFGFSKTMEQNYELLNKLQDFKILGLTIMVGISRKSMINRILNTKPSEALNGTIAIHTLALLNGASILRVHDVKEAVEVLKIVKTYNHI